MSEADGNHLGRSWRENLWQPIQGRTLVTYRMSATSYLATGCLQLAFDEGEAVAVAVMLYSKTLMWMT